MKPKQINKMLKQAGINPKMPIATERGSLLGITDEQEADMVQLIINQIKKENKLLGTLLQDDYNTFKGI